MEEQKISETSKKLKEDCDAGLHINPIALRDNSKFFGYFENYHIGDELITIRNDRNPDNKTTIPVREINWWATNNPHEKPKKDEKTFDLISKRWVDDSKLTDISKINGDKK